MGDFFVGQFLFEAQFQRVAQFGGEIANGLPHDGEAVVFGFRCGFVPELRDGGWITLTAVMPREHVTGDAEQPGARHGHRRQLICLADDLQECFLQEVAGRRGIGTAPREVAIQLARMLSIQLLDQTWLGLHVRRIVSCILVVASRTGKVHGLAFCCGVAQFRTGNFHGRSEQYNAVVEKCSDYACCRFSSIGGLPAERRGSLYSRRSGEELTAKASKQDGQIDSWLVRSTNGIPLRWVRDGNHGGRPDSWSFFKDGKAFLDEVDSDHDGKVDTIYLHVLSEDKTRVREFLFTLDDREKNVFTEREDSGWQELQKQEKKVK